LNGVVPSLPPVAAVDWELIGEGFGLTGVVARLHIRYERPSSTAPASLILKLPMALPESASHYREAQSTDDEATRRYFERCAREVDFYRAIAPAIDCVAPRVSYAATDIAERVIILLLEDLSGARNGDVLAGCGLEDGRGAIEQIARVHARWWDRETPDWLPWWGGDYVPRQQRLARQIGPFLDRWGHAIPPEVVSIIERLGTTYASLLAELDRRPRTILHADLHLDNVLFDAPGRTAPVILDWQSVLVGPAMIDAGRFIAESLGPDDRRHHEAELLAQYHARLVEGGVPNYSLDQLRVDYRLSLARTLPGIIGWLAHADLDRLQGRERQLMGAALGDGRLAAALLDHNVLGLLNDL
jgi:hypothetical protein